MVQVCVCVVTVFFFLFASPSISEGKLLNYLTEITEFFPELLLVSQKFFLGICVFRIIVPSLNIVS